MSHLNYGSNILDQLNDNALFIGGGGWIIKSNSFIDAMHPKSVKNFGIPFVLEVYL